MSFRGGLSKALDKRGIQLVESNSDGSLAPPFGQQLELAKLCDLEINVGHQVWRGALDAETGLFLGAGTLDGAERVCVIDVEAAVAAWQAEGAVSDPEKSAVRYEGEIVHWLPTTDVGLSSARGMAVYRGFFESAQSKNWDWRKQLPGVLKSDDGKKVAASDMDVLIAVVSNGRNRIELYRASPDLRASAPVMGYDKDSLTRSFKLEYPQDCTFAVRDDGYVFIAVAGGCARHLTLLDFSSSTNKLGLSFEPESNSSGEWIWTISADIINHRIVAATSSAISEFDLTVASMKKREKDLPMLRQWKLTNCNLFNTGLRHDVEGGFSFLCNNTWNVYPAIGAFDGGLNAGVISVGLEDGTRALHCDPVRDRIIFTANNGLYVMFDVGGFGMIKSAKKR